MLVYLGSLYCKQYGPRSDCSHLGAVWSGSILFASVIKSSLKGIWIYAEDVKSRQHFQDKNLLVEKDLNKIIRVDTKFLLHTV